MKNRLILLVVLWTLTLPVRAVTYGTHSTAYTPAIYTPSVHTSAPMVSMRSTSSMPMMTHGAAAPSYATSSSGASSAGASSAGASSPGRPIRPIHRVYANGDGEYDGEYNETTGLYWHEEEEEWRDTPPVGTIRDNGGVIEEWNGTAWVVKGQIADLGTPVGDAPWLWMLLLLAAYAFVRTPRLRNRDI